MNRKNAGEKVKIRGTGRGRTRAAEVSSRDMVVQAATGLLGAIGAEIC
jgi:hypothetical protein